MEPGGGKIAIPAAQAIHLHDEVIESRECPVDLTMPQFPFQRLKLLIDHREGSGNRRTAAHDMIGDLPHRSELHGKMKRHRQLERAEPWNVEMLFFDFMQDNLSW
jgi:hypothetical protein